MLNCRHVTRLLSQSMDAQLPWHRRLLIRLHLLYCVWCGRYAAQLKFLRKATQQLAQGMDEPTSERLSPEARERIRQRLRQAQEESSRSQ